jgi:hypothetical protein
VTGGPALSLIVATDSYPAIEDLLAALRAQTALDRLEIVIAAPAAVHAEGAALDGFAHVQWVLADASKSLAGARAAGVRAARAAVVAFTETHSFPEPGWARALIEAHDGPWAAVGPAMLNATPADARTWGQLYVDYGPWVAPVEGGPVDDIPGHGSAYKREVLLAYGEDLGPMLEAEWNLHRDMRARGLRLYLEPGATTRHLNMTQKLPSFLQWMYYSRGFASTRCRDWTRARRAAYAAGAPLIVLRRLAQVVRDMRRTGRLHVLPRALPSVLVSLSGSALGELVGYASGRAGDAAKANVKYEVHRERYVDLADDWRSPETN